MVVLALGVPGTFHAGDARATKSLRVLSGSVPRHWHAPRWWLPQALCIHHYEGAWNANTGNGYYGGMQFLLSTWRSAGGVIRPDLASPREQLFRAWIVYRRDGSSWREWGTAQRCGLR